MYEKEHNSINQLMLLYYNVVLISDNNYTPKAHKNPPAQEHLCSGEEFEELFWHHPVCVQDLPVPPDQDAC